MELEVAEKRKRKGSSKSKPIRCPTCLLVIDRKEGSTKCTKCNEDMHIDCLVTVKDDYYYPECISIASIHPMEQKDIELSGVNIPIGAKLPRTTTQIEQNRLKALATLQAKKKIRSLGEENTKGSIRSAVNNNGVNLDEKELNQRNLAMLSQLRELRIECKRVEIQNLVQEQKLAENQKLHSTKQVKHDRDVLTSPSNKHPACSDVDNDSLIDMSLSEFRDFSLKQLELSAEQLLVKQPVMNKSTNSVVEDSDNGFVTADDEAYECEVNVKNANDDLAEPIPTQIMKPREDMENNSRSTVREQNQSYQEMDNKVVALDPKLQGELPDLETSNLAPTLDIETEEPPHLENRENSHLPNQLAVSTSENNNTESCPTPSNVSCEREYALSNSCPTQPCGTEKVPDTVPHTEPNIIHTVEYTEYFTETTNDHNVRVYLCKLCNFSSTTSCGIKNHIRGSHKELKLTKDKNKNVGKDKCRRCDKFIHTEDVGECVICKGKEHFGCTKTGKEHKLDYKNGELTFTCVECCLPGFKKTQESLHRHYDTCSCNNPETNGHEKHCTKSKVENEKLINANKLLTSDNSELVKEVKALTRQLLVLKKENNQVKQDYEEMQNKYKILEVTYKKAKELSRTMQNASNDAIKDANMQNFKKEAEIHKLEKLNQKLVAENQTYESLLSDQINHQRIIEGETHGGSTYQSGGIENRNGYAVDDEWYESGNYDEDNPYDEYQSGGIENRDSYTVDDEWYDSGNYDENNPYNEYYGSQNDDYSYDDWNEGCEVSQSHRKLGKSIVDKGLYYDSRSENKRDRDDDVITIECDKKSQRKVILQENADNSSRMPSENKKKKVYCYFFNNKKCTRKNCRFLHEIAPACRQFRTEGKCSQKMCMYSHPPSAKSEIEMNRSQDDKGGIDKDFHDGRRPRPLQSKSTNKQQQEVEQRQWQKPPMTQYNQLGSPSRLINPSGTSIGHSAMFPTQPLMYIQQPQAYPQTIPPPSQTFPQQPVSFLHNIGQHPMLQPPHWYPQTQY